MWQIFFLQRIIYKKKNKTKTCFYFLNLFLKTLKTTDKHFVFPNPFWLFDLFVHTHTHRIGQILTFSFCKMRNGLPDAC